MSLEIPTWDKIIGALGSTTSEFGGSWGNLISDYYNGVDIGLTDPTKKPIIGTLTRYKNEKIGIFDNDQSHVVLLSADDIDTGGTRKLKLRRMNAPFEEDYAVLEGLAQAIINKTIDSDLNIITNIVDADIKAAAGILTTKLADSTNFVLINRANTYGAGQIQTFPSGTLKIKDADTNLTTITSSNQTSDFNLDIPILPANDTVATLGVANIFTNYMTLRKDSIDNLHIYRPNSTNTTETGIYFDLWNIVGAAKTYAAIRAYLNSNTDAAENGILNFLVMSGGTLTSKMQLHNNGNLSIGTNLRLILSESGLTTGRIFTFPDIASGVVALQNNANSFTAAQKITQSASGALVLYRTDNTVGNGIGTVFNLQNSSSAETSYAAIYGAISTNTAGAESGSLSFQIKSAGTTAEKMALSHLGALSFGATNKVTFDPSALTNARTIALPNAGGNLVLDSIGNSFAVQQTIQGNLTIPLVKRRTTNTVGDVIAGYYTELRDSGSNNTIYAKIETRIGVNTDTNETGYLDFYVMKNGSLGQYMILDGNQLSLGLSGARIVMDASGISTSSKTITWANLSGTPVLTTGAQTITGKTFNAPDNTLTNIGDTNITSHTSTKITVTNKSQLNNTILYLDDNQTMTQKTIDIRSNTLLRNSRYGVYRPSENNPIGKGEGALSGLITIGTRGTSTNNTGGKYDIWNTRAVIDDAAGLLKLDSFLCWRNGNPLIRFAFLFPSGTSTNRRMFKGLGPKRLINTNTNTEPLNSNESGFLFGFGSGDTNWHIFHNDASNTCVKTDTGLAITSSATNFILEITGTDSGGGSFTWTLYGVNSIGIRGSVLGTGTITSRIPASTTALYFQDVVITTDATIRPNNIHYDEVFM